MARFLVFAGTSEGRQLIEWLDGCGASVCASVATEYGRMLLPERVQVFTERMDEAKMGTLMRSLTFDCVIDATHPYAAQVSANIRAACGSVGLRCLRLVRPESTVQGCLYVSDAARAAELLAATTGNVLLTTGTKELDLFTRLPDFQSRIFPRVLPGMESLQRCLALGYRAANIIAMQGPFSREMNCATIRQIGAKILVTKESGDAGGFLEKLDAARDTDSTAIVIGRPVKESGYTLDELRRLLIGQYGVSAKQYSESRRCFPLFRDLSDERAVVFGGGAVALRRAQVLCDFCREVVVVAPGLRSEFDSIAAVSLRRAYQRGDCADFAIVVAATDDREVNRAIGEEARALGVLCNIADAPSECNFYFPGIAQMGTIVVGVSASGIDHAAARTVTEKIRGQLGGWLIKQEGTPE